MKNKKKRKVNEEQDGAGDHLQDNVADAGKREGEGEKKDKKKKKAKKALACWTSMTGLEHTHSNNAVNCASNFKVLKSLSTQSSW
eukprot:scaffold264136_cov17-Tisochrysis_lutea.AAC.1